jgi:spore germination protein
VTGIITLKLVKKSISRKDGKKMRRPGLIVPVLILGLAVATVWGYSQYMGRRSWEIKAENQYQLAFAALATNANNMEADLSKSLVSSSFVQNIRLLTNIWREANACQENLGQLPLTSLELSNTKNLLAGVGAYCFNTAQKKLIQGNRIDSVEWAKLQQLRNRIRVMVSHLGSMQQNFFNARLRWLEVDRLSSVKMTGAPPNLNSNQVTKSFLMLENGLKRTPDSAYEGNNLDFTPRPTGLTGKEVSSRAAILVVRRFLQSEYPGAQIRYERRIGGDFPSYMFRVTFPRRPAEELRCSVSVKGGHMAWFLGNRRVARSAWGLDRCGVKATAFLSQQGYPDMRVVARESYANIATFTCVPQRHQVLYYPELVKVQVAQDNGNILGCDFVSYLTFHDPRRSVVVKPAYSARQITDRLNSHFKLERIQRAEVLDEMFNKVSCYEVDGRQGADRYWIYYNAANGREEKIRRVDRNGNELI